MAPTPAQLLRTLLATLVFAITRVSAFSGEATAYASAGGRGVGACGLTGNLGSHFETYFASMNQQQYQQARCGDCIRIRGAKGTIVAKVVDKCMGCKYGDVDLSSNGLQATTGFAWDRKPVEWEWTSCAGVTTQTVTKADRARRRSNARRGRKANRGRKMNAAEAGEQ